VLAKGENIFEVFDCMMWDVLEVFTFIMMGVHHIWVAAQYCAAAG
jgi:hypothetical protein